MEAAMLMMRQAAEMRVAWSKKDLTSAAAHNLLRGWIELERYASRVMLESIKPIGWTF